MTKKIVIPLIVFSASLASPQNVVEREFEIAPGKKLEVEIKTGGSIDMKGWDNDRINVVVTKRGRDCDDVEIDFKERVWGLSILAHETQWFDSDCYLAFDIQVPTIFDLDLETKGGHIGIDNVEGEFAGKTMGGELNFSNLKGELDMVTMGGNIALRNSNVDGRVKTMGGNVVIEDVTGDVKGSSMGGNVTYKNVSQRGQKTVEVSTMGGNLDIDSKGGKVKAKTWGGNIEAKGDEVHVSTMGGNINVDEALSGADVHTMGVTYTSARRRNM